MNIDFTYEQENNNTVAFLDILLINNNNKLEFKVYYKSSNKHDHMNFYAHHNTKINRGILVSFYLRILNICTPKYLNDEFDLKENSFTQIHYAKTFYTICQNKSS